MANSTLESVLLAGRARLHRRAASKPPPPLGGQYEPTCWCRRKVMIGIVRLALQRPYTFVVMALLILIFGTTAALRTPTDIFPNINIPVVSVVFNYTGLPADDMAGRVVTFYERSLPNAVNDIEHIES